MFLEREIPVIIIVHKNRLIIVIQHKFRILLMNTTRVEKENK